MSDSLIFNVLKKMGNSSKTFVIGDIHGAYRALKQCLDRSEFDYEKDYLICLGDVCDGWPETKNAIEFLLSIKNLIYLLGNHDFWTLEWMKYSNKDSIWLSQGGQATVNSYASATIPDSHIQFLENAKPYYVLKNKLFVHAGIDPNIPVELQDINMFLWDRSLARTAVDLHHKGISKTFGIYDEIYVGHTPISDGPIRSGNLWLMDTGAGWSGVLTMMNIETKEIIQSDAVPLLYPGVEGRKKFK